MKTKTVPHAPVSGSHVSIPLHGLNLKLFVARGGESVNRLAEVLDISRQYIYNLYGEEQFKDEYIAALRKAKIMVPGITAPGGYKINNGESDSLRREIDSLNKLVASMEQTISYQEQLISTLKHGKGAGNSASKQRGHTQVALF